MTQESLNKAHYIKCLTDRVNVHILERYNQMKNLVYNEEFKTLCETSGISPEYVDSFNMYTEFLTSANSSSSLPQDVKFIIELARVRNVCKYYCEAHFELDIEINHIGILTAFVDMSTLNADFNIPDVSIPEKFKPTAPESSMYSRYNTVEALENSTEFNNAIQSDVDSFISSRA